MKTQPLNLRDRFLSFVAFEPNSGCWLWNGAASSSNGRDFYGNMSWMVAGKQFAMRANRLALFLFKPSEPLAEMACHHCDNAICVNPDHLYWGSNSQNQRDSISRGRHASSRHRRGRLSGKKVLSAAEVANSKMLVTLGASRPDIADWIGCRRSTMWNVTRGIRG